MTDYKCNKIVTEETNVQVVEWVPVCLMLMLSVILMIMAVVYSVVVLFSFSVSVYLNSVCFVKSMFVL